MAWAWTISQYKDKKMKVPSINALGKMMELVRTSVFPEYYDKDESTEIVLYATLLKEMASVVDDKEQQEQKARAFCDSLPEISRLLHTDVEAAMLNDPAVESHAEVVLCYPMTEVMIHYRTAHALLQLGVPLIPRMLTEMAHSRTGVDIHPGATIGEYFCIDHGTGVVIGATSIIGNRVMIYQGVTLGAKNFQHDEHGLPMNVPRHPIIEDNVTIYSNASVLGRIRIGHDAVIGGNVWITHDVPAHTRIQQSELKQIEN